MVLITASQPTTTGCLAKLGTHKAAGLQDATRWTMLIAERAGIRAMLTHPTDEDAARFCSRLGFIDSPLRERQLLLLLKDARRWVR